MVRVVSHATLRGDPGDRGDIASSSSPEQSPVVFVCLFLNVRCEQENDESFRDRGMYRMSLRTSDRLLESSNCFDNNRFDLHHFFIYHSQSSSKD